MKRKIDWPQIAALIIDLVLLYVVCVKFIGPIQAGASTINSVDPLMSSERASLVLADHALENYVEGAKLGFEALVIVSALYFGLLWKFKRRSAGKIIVDRFTVPVPDTQ